MDDDSHLPLTLGIILCLSLLSGLPVSADDLETSVRSAAKTAVLDDDEDEDGPQKFKKEASPTKDQRPVSGDEPEPAAGKEPTPQSEPTTAVKNAAAAQSGASPPGQQTQAGPATAQLTGGRPVPQSAPATRGRPAPQTPAPEEEQERRRREDSAVGEAATEVGGALEGLKGLEAAGTMEEPAAEGRSAAASQGEEPAESPDADEPAQPLADAAVNPVSEGDLLQSAAAGYEPIVLEQRMSVGLGPDGSPRILQQNGSAATPDQLASLSRTIREEPKAAATFKNFYRRIPRRAYHELKSDVIDRPELQGSVLRDVGISGDGRDLEWSKTCHKVDGRCNPNAKKPFYKKGKLISPEDIKSMWKNVPKLTDAEKKLLADAKNARGKLSKRSIADGLSDFLAGLKGIYAAARGTPREAAVIEDGTKVRMAGASAVPHSRRALAPAAVLQNGGEAGLRGFADPPPEPGPAAASASERRLLPALGLAAAGFFICILWRRKREAERRAAAAS